VTDPAYITPYRIVLHGELEAVDVVDTHGKIPKKGHCRTRRSSLNKDLESEKVRPLGASSVRGVLGVAGSTSRRFLMLGEDDVWVTRASDQMIDAVSLAIGICAGGRLHQS